VDRVEILLRHEEDTQEEGSPYSCEIMDEAVANFKSDITSLIGQDDNYLDFREDYVDGVEILLRHRRILMRRAAPTHGK
jgi:hypothetical protein